MKRLQLVLIAIAILLPHSLFAQEPDYFPMKIGNKWFYERYTYWGTLHDANKTIEVTDTTVINGRTYFVFIVRLIDIHYQPGKVHESKIYYRKLNNGDIARFNAFLNDEQAYYTVRPESLYRPYFYDLSSRAKWQIILISTGSLVRNPAGTFSKCFLYEFKYVIDGRPIPESYFSALAPNLGFIDEAAEGDRVFLVGAYLNGVVVGDTLLTRVKERLSDQQPSTLKLWQNYPNPFRNQTVLAYSVPALWRKPIQFAVFDLLGREIKTFVSHKTTSGEHHFLWDGTDNSGKEVKNGIYVARLTSGPTQQTIKICLTR